MFTFWKAIPRRHWKKSGVSIPWKNMKPLDFFVGKPDYSNYKELNLPLEFFLESATM